MTESNTPPSITDAEGTAHFTVCYPSAWTVGCSCGWVRTNVDVDVMDELCVQHLTAKGVQPW